MPVNSCASDMRVDVITLFPEMFDAIRHFGVTGKAIKRQLVSLNCWNPRDYAADKRATVDERPYGGGPGMVMTVQPLRDAIEDAKRAINGKSHVVYLSPQGQRLDFAGLKALSAMVLGTNKTSGLKTSLILLAGRYEGIDERVIEADVDEEISIGDYVLTGGELAAMVVIDALTRLIPGALGHEEAAQQDSFVEGILDCPHYSRPEEITGQRVPEVLLQGNHQAIARWRKKQALGKTWIKRPELLDALTLTEADKDLLQEFISEQVSMQ